MSLLFNLTRMIPIVKIKPSRVELRLDAPANDLTPLCRVRSTQTRVPLELFVFLFLLFQAKHLNITMVTPSS
jgi:hypothetical protein